MSNTNLKFEEFKKEFSEILKKRHGIGINDCTDEEFLKNEFLDGTTPTESVEFIANKYDLDRIDEFPFN